MEKALNILRTAIANQMDWKDIQEIVEEAAENGDPILSRIRKLKLDINHFTMMLSNPFSGKITLDKKGLIFSIFKKIWLLWIFVKFDDCFFQGI